MTKTQKFFLLTSPPASGKTFWVKCLKNVVFSTNILVISPLRALADECRNNWGNDIMVMTPEEWLGKKTFAEIVIFDEFHLFFYWGDSFRPLMWEVFYELSQSTPVTFALTATLSQKMRADLSTFETQFDEMYWYDFGNQKLKTPPAQYLLVPSRSWLLRHIKHQKKNHDVKLIFCRFRNEVLEMEKELSSLGFSCISCIGGESKHMAGKLLMNPKPDYIISTTVLSHGVNLPVISKIYFTYKVDNLDFWIQMVARGGRRGESYSVFALERPAGIRWNSLFNWINILFESIRLNFSMPQFLFPKR